MKKRLMQTVLATVVFGVMSTPAWAVWTSVKITTITAGVVTGGSPVADFNLAIRNTNNPFGANQPAITWSNVTPPSTQWKIADHLILLIATVTSAGGGIKIYTDNTHPTANPQFVDLTPGATTGLNLYQNADSVASGLVSVAAPSVPPLPTAWSIKDSTKIVEGGTALTGIGAVNPNNPTGSGYNNPFQWLYFTDKYNWVGVDMNANNVIEQGEPAPQALDAPFVTMVNVNGIHVRQAPGDFVVQQDGTNTFVYMEADFTSASAQSAYGTNSMRVEAYIQ